MIKHILFLFLLTFATLCVASEVVTTPVLPGLWDQEGNAMCIVKDGKKLTAYVDSTVDHPSCSSKGGVGSWLQQVDLRIYRAEKNILFVDAHSVMNRKWLGAQCDNMDCNSHNGLLKFTFSTKNGIDYLDITGNEDIGFYGRYTRYAKTARDH